jgi:hypothetical protein
MTDPRWLTSREAAAYLGMKPDGFRKRVREGIIPAGSSTLGPRLARWRIDVLDAFMSGSAQTRGSTVSDRISRKLAERASGKKEARRRHGQRVSL